MAEINLKVAAICADHGDDLELEMDQNDVIVRIHPCERCKEDAFSEGYARGRQDAIERRQ